MPGVKLSTFGGVAPRPDPRLLPQKVAQDALNALLDSGVIEPLPTDDPVGATAGVDASTKAIFRLTDAKWATFDERVDVCRSPIAEDQWDRVYWTDSAYPKMADLVTAATGTGPYPAGEYRLGIPKPAANVSTTVTGTADPGAVPGERAYVFTYVSQYGEEGEPSVAGLGDIIPVSDGQTVTVTFPTNPTGNFNLITKRLYRTDPNGAFRFVADVALATASYDDTLLDDELGEEVPSTDWDPPPDDVAADHPDGPLQGLTLLADGSMVGFSGQTFCQSEPNLPHAFPSQYQFVTDWPIVGIAEIEAGVLIATEGKPYLATGVSPSSRDPRPLDSVLGCLSRTSMVDMGDYALYASSEGLVLADGSQASVITDTLISPKEWRDSYAPSSIHAYRWEGKYVAFFDDGAGNSGGFIFDPRGKENALMPLDFYAQCGYLDPTEGALYIVVGGALYRFARGGAVRTARWKSKVFRSPRPLCPAVAKVVCDAYPLTFKLWSDGSLKHTQSVASAEFFYLPGGYKAFEFEFEVSGVTGPVHEVLVAESPTEQV